MPPNLATLYPAIIRTLEANTEKTDWNLFDIADAFSVLANITQKKTISSHTDRMVRMGYLEDIPEKFGRWRAGPNARK